MHLGFIFDERLTFYLLQPDLAILAFENFNIFILHSVLKPLILSPSLFSHHT